MKSLFVLVTLLAASFVWAGEPSVKGVVLETKDVESYTYLRLKTKEGETWAAVSKTKLKKGAEVTLENVTEMSNFESKTLKKTFPRILFGSLAGEKPSGHGMPAPAKPADVGDVRVPKATGPNAFTVAEIISKGAELKDKAIVVRGKIVKYNAAIMGKNWIHLRDGSGAAADNTHDILITTAQSAKIGDIVTVKGNVRTDKDFGAGYAYKVLIEEATLEQ